MKEASRGWRIEERGSTPAPPSSIPHPLSSGIVVLGSRSLRRAELLSLVVPRERIRVVPPSSAEEAGFEGLTSRAAIEERLRAIAAAKRDDVLRQIGGERGAVVVTADTVVVVNGNDGRMEDGGGKMETGGSTLSPPSSILDPPSSNLLVLGQPPESDWREVTRRWFLDHYAGRTHSVLTGLCVAAPSGSREAVVESRVTFRADAADLLDWYLDMDEPRGVAGGYAIQRAGSVFVERIEGSLTNVVGLPLRELVEALGELGVR